MTTLEKEYIIVNQTKIMTARKNLIFLLLLMAIGCKKKDSVQPASNCYHCYSTNSGVPTVSKDTCGSLTGTIDLTDANGNHLNVICVPK
jgi:hypothetical protein